MSLDRSTEAAPLFAALGDPTRLALLSRLCDEGPQSITCLAEQTPVTRQSVTKHLQVLAEAGLVRDARRGRERIWEVAPDRLDEARQWLDRASERWDEAIARLRRLVEE